VKYEIIAKIKKEKARNIGLFLAIA